MKVLSVKEVSVCTLPFYSTLMRLHLDAEYKKDRDLLESRGDHKDDQGLEHLCC